MTFNILITLLKNHLCPTPNEIAEQHHFYIRNQNNGETILVFVKTTQVNTTLQF